jgi:multidrug efflux pump subunit AcrA (membrane-fusion protein)
MTIVFHRPLLWAGLAAMALMAGCGTKASKPAAKASAAQGSEARPISVTVAEVQVRDVPLHINATGTFVAEELSDVAPLTAGRVAATLVDVGAYVKQGDVIVRLDDSDARLRLQQAKANSDQTEAALRQAEAKIGLGRGAAFNPDSVPEVQAALAAYESAQAEVKLAEADARRYANLVNTGDVSRSNYEKQLTQAETAKARSNAARRQYEAAANTARQNYQGVESAQGTLEAIRAQLAMAQKALADTVVRAPISGYLSDRPVAVGEYVATSSKIATILRVDPIKLQLQVPEAEVGQLQKGLSVEAQVATFPGRKFQGRVKALNPALDANSRALSVEVTMANPKIELRPGMFATAQILLPGVEKAILVPRKAVLTDPNTESAQMFVIAGDTARVRIVRVGESVDGTVRILSGISSGDILATSGLEQLFDGAKVARK